MVKYIYCDDVRHFSSFLYKLIPTLLGVKEDVQHIFLRAKDGCHPDHAKIELYLTLLRIEFYRNVKIEGCDQTMRIVPRPAELEAGYMRAYELASRFEDEQGQPMFADAMPRVHVAILDLIRRDEVSDPEDFQMWGVSGGKVKAFRSGSQVESLWSTLSNFFPPVIGPVLAQKMALLRIAKLLIDAHVRWKGKQDVGTYLLTLLFKGREAFLAAGLRMPPEFEVLCLSALDSGERWGVDAATFYEEHGLTEEHILADQDAFENKMYSIVQRLRVNDTEVQDAQHALESAVAIHTGEGDRTWSRLKDMLSQVRHICNIVCNNDHNATSPLAKELVQLHQNLKAKAAALNTLLPSAGPSSASPRDSLAAGARVLHFDHSARQQLKDRRVVKARTQKETRSLDVGQRFGAITWKELHLMEKLEEDHSGAAEIIRAWNEKVDAAEGEEVHTLKPTPFSPRHQGDVPQKMWTNGSPPAARVHMPFAAPTLGPTPLLQPPTAQPLASRPATKRVFHCPACKKRGITIRRPESVLYYDAEAEDGSDSENDELLPATPEDLAIAAAGLSADGLTAAEEEAFKGMLGRKGGAKEYLKLRNHVLLKWEEDVKRTLTREMCAEDEIMVSADLKIVFSYLERHGLINKGIVAADEKEAAPLVDPALLRFKLYNLLQIVDMEVTTERQIRKKLEEDLKLDLSEFKMVIREQVTSFLDNSLEDPGPAPRSEPTAPVIVIGAGPAGLAAARHLHKMGKPVIVLEGRDRVGGRVHTDRTSLSAPVDLGASIITGVEATPKRKTVTGPGVPADPSAVVCSQLGLGLHELTSDLPLYDTATGSRVDKALDEKVEKLRDELLDETRALVDKGSKEMASSSLEAALSAALAKKMASRGEGEEAGLDDLSERLLDWHWAHLEYGCSAKLKEVSLEHWNQDEEYGGFGGKHCMVKEGYSTPMEALAGEVDVRLSSEVTEVEYGGEEGVRVHTSDGAVLEGSAAVVTVPLGCLKAGSPRFAPELPSWKTDAVQRLGFGHLNKVVMEFTEVFWDSSVAFFGAARGGGSAERGVAYMFWSLHELSQTPILVALFSGEAAAQMEQKSDEETVSAAMEVLRKVCGAEDGKVVPDKPERALVTRWGQDPWARGAYSYVATGASGEDYDLLGHAVARRVYFAGEHTCKQHPDTVGGAMMTGHKAAVQVLKMLEGEVEDSAFPERMSVVPDSAPGPSRNIKQEADDDDDDDDAMLLQHTKGVKEESPEDNSDDQKLVRPKAKKRKEPKSEKGERKPKEKKAKRKEQGAADAEEAEKEDDKEDAEPEEEDPEKVEADRVAKELKEQQEKEADEAERQDFKEEVKRVLVQLEEANASHQGSCNVPMVHKMMKTALSNRVRIILAMELSRATVGSLQEFAVNADGYELLNRWLLDSVDGKNDGLTAALLRILLRIPAVTFKEVHDAGLVVTLNLHVRSNSSPQIKELAEKLGKKYVDLGRVKKEVGKKAAHAASTTASTAASSLPTKAEPVERVLSAEEESARNAAEKARMAAEEAKKRAQNLEEEEEKKTTQKALPSLMDFEKFMSCDKKEQKRKERKSGEGGIRSAAHREGEASRDGGQGSAARGGGIEAEGRDVHGARDGEKEPRRELEPSRSHDDLKAIEKELSEYVKKLIQRLVSEGKMSKDDTAGRELHRKVMHKVLESKPTRKSGETIWLTEKRRNKVKELLSAYRSKFK
ncbi:hypothetical protein CYMTET_8205 [Cymbomonas tetramitiformis]|uniref:Uncharacterized protein n=1 Tax=Cymbomonas tetramitiformis TaxID=36881 RepID=A0AAE0GTX1_9CHLO|nr:hypothetical protein CYMTET_8205 [Cymbomonas tetramitiformis]